MICTPESSNWAFLDVRELYLSSGLPPRRPLDEYPGSSHRPLRMYPNFTYQVTYHPVGHLISTPWGAPVIRIPESSRPPWMYRNFTYTVAYHPVGHLISTRGALLGNAASTRTANFNTPGTCPMAYGAVRDRTSELRSPGTCQMAYGAVRDWTSEIPAVLGPSACPACPACPAMRACQVASRMGRHLASSIRIWVHEWLDQDPDTKVSK